jgi:biopolymer transport protein ExbB/TolQ
MIEVFLQGGLVMWPLLAAGLGVLWISLRTSIRLRRAAPPEHEIQRGLQAILFLGVASAVLGTVGTLGGLVEMASAIRAVGETEAALIWGGLGVSLIPLMFGLSVALLAAILWFALREWGMRLPSPHEEA